MRKVCIAMIYFFTALTPTISWGEDVVEENGWAEACYVEESPNCPGGTTSYCVLTNGLCPTTQTQYITPTGKKLVPKLMNWFPQNTASYVNDGAVYAAKCSVKSNCIQVKDDQGNLIGCTADLANPVNQGEYTSGHVNWDRPCTNGQPPVGEP